MKQRLPRVPRGRSGFVLGLVLIVAALVAPDEGRAASATLIMPDVCGDPAAVFDHQWATVNFNASDLYYMAGDGSVVKVSQEGGDFKNYEDLYVFAHGDGVKIGGMTYANFVGGLETVHPSPPKSIFFGVCYSATGSKTLLKQTNDKYNGKVNKLTGSNGACALTGNGSRDLSKANYRVGAVPSNQVTYDQVLDNIIAKWNGQVYPGTAMTYAAYCQAALAPFNAGTLRAFMATVVTQFSQVDIDPQTSTDYLALVALNTGGQALFSCGQDPTGTGVVICP